MKSKLLLSSLTVVAMVAVIAGGTTAMFSDTETAEANVTTAGSVTLLINNITHTYAGDAGNAPVYNDNGVSFTLDDVKPLDEGDIDYEILNGANEAYVCALVTETDNAENGVVNPEQDLGDTGPDGELQNYLSFQFGGDSGTLADISGQWQTVGTVSPNTSTNSAIDYCFGEYDGGGACVANTVGNVNEAQTDTVTFDIEFYAEQTRNNPGFTCADLNEEAVSVGAFAFAYSAPEPASCDLTVDGVGTGVDEYITLAVAEAAAGDGDTICVDTGTYEENVTVDVPNVTILGLNDPKGGDKATVEGRMDIDADGVTVSGLEFTDPDGGYGIVIDGVSDTEISNNSFVDIATTLAVGSAQAIYYNGGGAAATGLTISGNMIDNIGNVSMENPSSGSSAKGIFIGDSTAGPALSGVTISNNSITNIFVSNAAWPVGRGAYGILVNYGVGVSGLTVTENTIATLDGLWSHGVGLETDTPGAVVTRNDISDLKEDKGDTDAIGVFFESNPGGATTVVNENNFGADIEAYAVALHPGNPAVTVNAENNWWGDATPADEAFAGPGTIDFTPFAAAPFPTN